MDNAVLFSCLVSSPLSPSDRFRQLEVFQQVTTAFSSLVGSSSSSLVRAPQRKELSPEALERRRRMAMLFRRASKKSLNEIHNKTQDKTTPESLQPQPFLGDKKVQKRTKPGQKEVIYLSRLAEEPGAGPEPQDQPQITSLKAQEGASWPSSEGHPVTADTFLQRKKIPGTVSEFEFEMDEASQTATATDHQRQH